MNLLEVPERQVSEMGRLSERNAVEEKAIGDHFNKTSIVT
jgi:hypothetical protein